MVVISKRWRGGDGLQLTVSTMILIVFCLLFVSSIVSEAIDAEVPPPNCAMLKQQKPLQYINESNKYGLWPGLRTSNDLKTGRTIFAFEEAMEVIWRNQNPPDCKTAKYIIAEGWPQGFGSEIHIYGLALGVAIDTGRVFVQHGGWAWRYRNSMCRQLQKKSLECYYLPFSKCTVVDAIQSMYPTEYATLKAKQQNRTLTWTKEEDMRLAELVQTTGSQGMWNLIAMDMPEKTATQCFLRWRDAIRNQISKHPKMRKKRVFVDKPTLVDLATPSDGVYPFNRIRYSEVDAQGKIHLLTNHSLEDFSLLRKSSNSSSAPLLRTHDQVLVLAHEDFYLRHRTYVPRIFQRWLTQCQQDLHPSAHYLWWRAISATYLLRPNPTMLRWLDRARDPVIQAVGGKCISTYVRHGDKAVEMRLVAFARYASTAQALWKSQPQLRVLAASDENNPVVVHIESNQTLTGTAVDLVKRLVATENWRKLVQPVNLPNDLAQEKHRILPRVLYLSTENVDVFFEAEEWASSQHVVVRRSRISREILSDQLRRVKMHDLEKGINANRLFEYHSYLLHLQELLSCETLVCTMASNYCRVVDELRSTVGARANKIAVDLSVETCPRPIITTSTEIKKKPQNGASENDYVDLFCAHNYSLADYRGEVHDPLIRLW